jgi:hypothetical protein
MDEGGVEGASGEGWDQRGVTPVRLRPKLGRRAVRDDVHDEDDGDGEPDVVRVAPYSSWTSSPLHSPGHHSTRQLDGVGAQ